MGVRKPVLRRLLIGTVIVFVLIALFINSLSHQKPIDVVRVNSVNPKLQAAIKEAVAGLPAFIKELSSPKPDEGFAVKGRFQTPSGPEYLWVKNPKFANGKFSGALDQPPMALAGKHKGDSIEFAEKDAVDWLIKDDQGIRGEFTEKALDPAGR